MYAARMWFVWGVVFVVMREDYQPVKTCQVHRYPSGYLSPVGVYPQCIPKKSIENTIPSGYLFGDSNNENHSHIRRPLYDGAPNSPNFPVAITIGPFSSPNLCFLAHFGPIKQIYSSF